MFLRRIMKEIGSVNKVDTVSINDIPEMVYNV